MDAQFPAAIADLLVRVAGQVATTVEHNWPFLLIGIVTAAALKVYVGTERIAVLFRQRTGVAVGGAVATAVATPFCSCGTTAVVLSMLAASVPWAPVVAFMVASPLTSPDELFLSAGLFGWPFAMTFFMGSIVLGLAGGIVAYGLEGLGLLRDQARFAERVDLPAEAEASGSCGEECSAPRVGNAPAAASLGPGAASVAEFPSFSARLRLPELAAQTYGLGRQMVLLFLGFAAIGYAAIDIVPTAWLTTLLGGSSPLSVVFAATLGIPFYMSTEASLPLIASLMHGGMGAGPAMAFLVTGAGTSVGAMAGALLIARWRVVAVVVGTLWVGAIVLGLITAVLL